MCHYRQINRWALETSELSTSFLLTLFLALFTLNKFEYSRWIKRLGFSFSRLSDAVSRHVLIIIDLRYCKKKFSKLESVLVPLLKFILILIIFLLWKNVPCYLFPSPLQISISKVLLSISAITGISCRQIPVQSWQ